MFENITTLIMTLVGVTALFLIIGWLGFQVPAQIEQPFIRVGEVPKFLEDKKVKLPGLIRQWIVNNHGDQPVIPGELVAWGRGKIVGRDLPLIGPLWMPVRWVLYMEPGKSFAWKAQILWFKWVFIKGGDEYKDGIGKFAWGNSVLENQAINRSEAELLWGFTLFFAPSILIISDQLRWETDNDHQGIHLNVPISNDDELTMALSLDPESGQVDRMEMMRSTSTAGKFLPFQMKFGEYCQFESGFTLPTKMETRWKNEPNLVLEVAAVNYHYCLKG